MDAVNADFILPEADEKTLFDNVCQSYVDSKNLIAHQIGSYNRFVNGVHSIFEKALPILIKSNCESEGSDVSHPLFSAEISFGKLKLFKPTWTDAMGVESKLFPSESRFRKMTYSASVHADIKLKVSESLSACKNENMASEEHRENDSFWNYAEEDNGKHDTTCTLKEGVLKNIFVGKIPVMVMSNMCYLSDMCMEDQRKRGQCQFDNGGYFIVNGSEKVMIPQEKSAGRMVCSNLDQKQGLTCMYTSSSSKDEKVVKRRTTADIIFSRVKSKNEQGVPFLKVNFFGLKTSVPAIILFRALGVADDKEIIERICEDVNDDEMVNLIHPSIYQADEIAESVESISAVKSRQRALEILEIYTNLHFSVEDILRENLFPHLKDDNAQKIMLLGYMFNCLLSCHLGRRKLDARNDFKFKRVALTGDLCREKLCKLLHLVVRNIKKGLEKISMNAEDLRMHLQYHIDGSIITKGFIHALSTGNWEQSTTGVAATLKRTNVLDALSHLRQIRISAPGFVKHGGQTFRNTHAIGRVCVVETPDDENSGVVNMLAFGCEVTSETSTELVQKVINIHCPKELKHIPSNSMKMLTRVFLNGKWVAVIHDHRKLVTELRYLRQESSIDPEVEIAEDPQRKEVHIFCDGGRLVRPLIRIKNDYPCITVRQMEQWQLQTVSLYERLLHNGVVELIGPEEEQRCIIAEDLKELRSSRKRNINHFTHCQLHPILSFSVGTILIPFFNHNTYNRVMYQAQKHGRQAIGLYTTCLSTRSDTTSHQLQYPQTPLCRTDLQMHWNRQHLSNGQNAIVAVAPFYGYNQEDSIIINRSAIDRGLFRSDHYQSLNFEIDVNTEKFSRLNANVDTVSNLDDDGLPIIGSKFGPHDVIINFQRLKESTSEWEECSTKLNAVNKGRVDQVILTSDEDGNPMARVKLRETRLPVDGDKFSSRHGQKGVIGFVCDEEDMFFTPQGIVPDIIINPHAFPTRETVGQLIEGITAKVSAMTGKRGDCGPFKSMDVAEFWRDLKREKEVLINGRTGEKLLAKISVTPVFYQRLVHMASDKWKCRSKGFVDSFTKQPVAGRKRQGGVKFGEMERDCLIVHGASANLRERLFELSDPYVMYVCAKCNIVVWQGREGLKCSCCRKYGHVVQVPMPYACKIMYQELLSMGIQLKFWVEPL